MSSNKVQAANASPEEEFRQDVIAGLSAPQKYLDPKYFYDAEGCALFEKITQLPEYYITRTETAMMRDIHNELQATCGPISTVVEFGSGSGQRTQLLLNALEEVNYYVPIDVAPELLAFTRRSLAGSHEHISVEGIVGDFTEELIIPDTLPRPWLGYFPGSTIGNFSPTAAILFLGRARHTLGPGTKMLVGVDLVKSVARLEAAYDDADGVTAAFNKNILTRINRELGAAFDTSQFQHRAIFNQKLSRIEMHLESTCKQRIATGQGKHIEFRAGETIHTENSHKYTVSGFAELAHEAGWQVQQHWTDKNRDFSLHLLQN